MSILSFSVCKMLLRAWAGRLTSSNLIFSWDLTMMTLSTVSLTLILAYRQPTIIDQIIPEVKESPSVRLGSPFNKRQETDQPRQKRIINFVENIGVDDSNPLQPERHRMMRRPISRSITVSSSVNPSWCASQPNWFWQFIGFSNIG